MNKLKIGKGGGKSPAALQDFHTYNIPNHLTKLIRDVVANPNNGYGTIPEFCRDAIKEKLRHMGVTNGEAGET